MIHPTIEAPTMHRAATADSTRRFNRACAALALSFILVSHLVRGASYQDFPQYYMGGLMARAGLWDAIYPRPTPGAIYNAGWGDQSTVRDAYREMGERHGIDEFGFRFIQSPPVAVLFIPLTLLDYPQAYRVWIVVLSLCMWGVALQAARIHTIARGREDMGAGIVILVIACSVLAYRAVRVGNVSPIVGLCVGVIVLDLVKRGMRVSPLRTPMGRRANGRGAHATIAGAAMTIGAFAKYATPVLAPIHLMMNRWAPLIWSAILMLLIVVGTWLLSGGEPFEEFARSIAPTLGRSHPHRANQSFEGLILRTTNHATLPPRWTIPLRAAQVLVLVTLLLLIWRRRRALPTNPSLVFAASAGLIAWLLAFGPLYWEHYPVYLCPLWGWLAWEARRSPARMVLVIAALAMVWVPVPAIQAVRLPEPINSHILASTLIILLLAAARLRQGERMPERAEDVETRG